MIKHLIQLNSCRILSCLCVSNLQLTSPETSPTDVFTTTSTTSTDRRLASCLSWSTLLYTRSRCRANNRTDKVSLASMEFYGSMSVDSQFWDNFPYQQSFHWRPGAFIMIYTYLIWIDLAWGIATNPHSSLISFHTCKHPIFTGWWFQPPLAKQWQLGTMIPKKKQNNVYKNMGSHGKSWVCDTRAVCPPTAAASHCLPLSHHLAASGIESQSMGIHGDTTTLRNNPLVGLCCFIVQNKASNHH